MFKNPLKILYMITLYDEHFKAKLVYFSERHVQISSDRIQWNRDARTGRKD